LLGASAQKVKDKKDKEVQQGISSQKEKVHLPSHYAEKRYMLQAGKPPHDEQADGYGKHQAIDENAFVKKLTDEPHIFIIMLFNIKI